jgi:hypothetical protein
MLAQGSKGGLTAQETAVLAKQLKGTRRVMWWCAFCF